MLVDDDSLSREALLESLGTPTERVTLSATEAAGREYDSEKLAERVANLEPEKLIELIEWKSTCWLKTTDYFIGVFDPDTGAMLEVSGERLFHSWSSVTPH